MAEGCGWASVCWQRISVWTGAVAVTWQEGVGFQEAEPANPSTEKQSVDLGMLNGKVLHLVLSGSSYWEPQRAETSQLN